MVAGAFPLAKLAYLSIRQVSKPIASQIKNGAKRSNVFRKYVCLPTAQLYHWAETSFKMYLLGLGKPTHVAPLNEQMAVELGADILGEAIVFLVAAGSVVFEVQRAGAKAQLKEDQLYDRIQQLESQVQTLGFQNEQHSVKIVQLQHELAYSGPIGKLKQKFVGKHPPDTPDTSGLVQTRSVQDMSKHAQANTQVKSGAQEHSGTAPENIVNNL